MKDNKGKDEEILDFAGAVNVLGISKPTLYKWLSDGRIKGFKVGGKWRFYREYLLDFIDRESKKGERKGEELMEKIIRDAVSQGASDIHFEPLGEKMRIRVRISGIMSEYDTGTKYLDHGVIGALKKAAGLEHVDSSYLDGRFRREIGDSLFELRLSVMPFTGGEKAVIRVLDHRNTRLGFKELGFSQERIQEIHEVLGAAHGLVILSGPAGSGTSTTAYSCLNHLNEETVNISTIEKPVELNIGGIFQSSLSENETFTGVARHILRQDPDIVYFSTIDTGETMEILMKIALTGHLVLTTVKTRDATSVIDELRKFDEPDNIVSSTLVAIVNQRLVRKLCDRCKTPYTPGEKLLKEVGLSHKENVTFYRSNGCEHCQNNGYRGRTALIEILRLDEELREMIRDGLSGTAIRKEAISRDFKPLCFDGIARVLEGFTSMEEIQRVTSLKEARA